MHTRIALGATALLLASAIVGCQRPKHAPGPQPPKATHDAPTGDTGTQATTDPDVPWLLEPGTTLVGVPTPDGMGPAEGYSLGSTWGILPPVSEDRPVFLVGSYGGLPEHFAGVPKTLIFTDPLPRGRYEAVGLETGNLDAMLDPGVFFPAGDINADGHADFWLWEGLYLGPFDRRIDWQTEWHAKVEGGIGDVGVSTFDGDGDGYTDVMFAGRFQDAVIHYGPFEGTIPSFYSEDYDPTESTATAPGCGTLNEYTALLPDLLGPGQHAVAIGVDQDESCGTDTWIFGLEGPRGRWVPLDEAVAWVAPWGSLYARAVGDVNGDAVVDLLLRSTTSGSVHAGPIVGAVTELPLAVEFTGDRTIVREGMGDVNGDGLSDLLVAVQYDPDAPDFPKDYYLVPSPFEGPVNAREQGIFLANREGMDTLVPEWGHGDFDADGREDVVCFTKDSDNGAGAVRIWYAADLFPD